MVYDPEHRYQEICLGLDSPSLRVFDAGAGSIVSRTQALQALRELRQGALVNLLVYVPKAAPLPDDNNWAQSEVNLHNV